MFCSNCGREQADESQFCSECGAALAGQAVDAARASQKPKKKMSGCIIALIVVAAIGVVAVPIIGIVSAIAIPNLLNAIDRGKQKRTMADLRSIGTAIESYSIDNDAYPVAASMSTLKGLIEPLYFRTAPLTDGWTRTFQVVSNNGEYVVCSGGKDGGSCTSDAAGPQTSFDASITFANGQFVQWPEGTQN